MTEQQGPRRPTTGPVADLSHAPLPTARTLRLRRNVPYQAARFAAFNLRILKMALKGDH